jgi:hypothetical protein
LHLNAKSSDENANLTKADFEKLIFSADESLPCDLTKHTRTNPAAEFDLTAKLLMSRAENRIDFDQLPQETIEKLRERN